MKMVNKSTYDSIAESWDSVRKHPIKGVKEFLEKLDNNSKILDLGCGTGRHMLLAKNIGLQNIKGMDFSKGQIAVAKKKGLDVTIQDILNLDFSDDEFDAIIFVAVLHHLIDKEEQKTALGEAFRVLKHKGKLLLSVWNLESEYLRKDIKKGKTKMISRNIADISFMHENKRYPRNYYLFEKSELSKLLTEVGFTIEKSWSDSKNLFLECSKI